MLLNWDKFGPDRPFILYADFALPYLFSRHDFMFFSSYFFFLLPFDRTLSNWLLEFEKWTPSIIVVSYKVRSRHCFIKWNFVSNVTSCFECNSILCNCCWKEFVSFCKFQFQYKKKQNELIIKWFSLQPSLLISVCITYMYGGLLNERKLITATPNTCRLIKLPSRLSQPCNQAMHFLFWEQAPITLTFHTEICWCKIGKRPTQFNSV